MVEKERINSYMVNAYCTKRRIHGLMEKGNLWLDSESTDKPEDLRKKGN